MKSVRAFWNEHVGAAGAEDTGADAPVVKAFRTAWNNVNSGNATCENAVAEAVWASSEWQDAHRRVVVDLFHSIAECMPSESTLSALLQVRDVEEVARRIVDFKDGGEDVIAGNANENSQKQRGSTPEPCSPDDTPMVDEEWLRSFEQAFGRDAFVHEYVLVRPMDDELRSLFARHKQAFERMRSVHAKYLDETLTEQQFVKSYVPRIYHSIDVPDDVRREALRRPQYRTAMQARLSSLHLIACGCELSDDESNYLFEKDVFEKELPLDTEELNDVVAAFVRRGEEIKEQVGTIVDVYLRRDAERDEIDAWVFPFLTQSCAEDDLRTELVSGHEFHSVLTDTIRERTPDLRSRELFRRLSEALDLPELRTVKSRYDLDSMLEKAGIFDAQS